MALKLVTAPTVEPIGLEEAKLHCRVDVTEDDYLIQGYIRAARETVETMLRHALCTQTWDLFQDAVPDSEELVLPLPPLVSVTWVKYTPSSTGVATLFAAASYSVDAVSTPGRIVLNDGYSWPSDGLVKVNGFNVRFVCGFGEEPGVPSTARLAMLLLVEHWYENREPIMTSGAVPKEIPLGIESLIWAAGRDLRF